MSKPHVCPVCQGTGTLLPPEAVPNAPCRACNGKCVVWEPDGAWKIPETRYPHDPGPGLKGSGWPEPPGLREKLTADDLASHVIAPWSFPVECPKCRATVFPEDTTQTRSGYRRSIVKEIARYLRGSLATAALASTDHEAATLCKAANCVEERFLDEHTTWDEHSAAETPPQKDKFGDVRGV